MAWQSTCQLSFFEISQVITCLYLDIFTYITYNYKLEYFLWTPRWNDVTKVTNLVFHQHSSNKLMKIETIMIRLLHKIYLLILAIISKLF